MVLFLMRNFVLKFALPILICNVLFIYIGFVANIGFVGSFAGGLMAIGTDPIIIMIGVLLGVLTVFKQLNFSLIYLILGAVLSTVVIHFILGTTKFIVDIIRFDALLIISSITILAASFFSPQTKNIKPKIKINTDPSKQRGVRLLILIFSAAIFGFILFSGQTNFSNQNKITRTLFGKYISKDIIKSFHKERSVMWCEDTCKPTRESNLYKSGKITKDELNQKIQRGDIKVKYYGVLKGNYRLSMWIAHIVIFILLMAIVLIFRFHIAHRLTSLTSLTEIKPKKSKSELPKSIKNFFKNI
jgi:hypothetical protein